MAVQIKVQHTDDIIRSAIIAGVQGGLGQQAIAEKLGHNKSWLNYWLKKLALSWRDLKQDQIQIESSKVQDVQQSSKNTKPKGKSLKKKKPSTTPPPPTGSDPGDTDPNIDPDDDIEFEIPQQLKEMVKCSEYVCDHIEKASFGDAIKFYEKTKMLENEDKDFAEDNKFLGEVEEMLRLYTIVQEQVPALDIRVDNPDAVEEGI